jgi:hypothetical protein
MPNDRQLWLPFVPSEISPIIDPSVEARVGSCQGLLKALHISPRAVSYVLSRPECFWRTVVEERGGKRRVCHVPEASLGKAQLRLARWLSRRWGDGAHRWPTGDLKNGWGFVNVATAFERGCSVVVNADWHRDNRSSLRLDLEDAFGSIERKHIYRALLRQRGIWPPKDYDWYLDAVEGEKPDERSLEGLAWVLCRLFTHQGRLPQGAPSSPIVFNLMMRRFDQDVVEALDAPVGLMAWSRMRTWWFASDGGAVRSVLDYRGIVYTRYGDDLCFSSPEERFPAETERAIRAIVAGHHLRLNPRKTRRDGSGVLEMPGAVIIDGRVLPLRAYLERLGADIRAGRLDAAALQGHKAFLNQFGRRAACRALRGTSDSGP